MSDHLWFEEDDGEPWFYVGNRDYYIKHRMTPDKAERWAAILAAGRPVPARPTGEEGAPIRVFAGPSGEVSYLPDRLRAAEGTGAIDHSHLLACARGVVDFATHEPIDGPLMRALLSALRAACGDSIEDVAVRAGLPREMAPSEWPTPRAMAEIACRKRTIGQGFQSGFEEGVIAERARFEAAPLVSLADYAKPRT